MDLIKQQLVQIRQERVDIVIQLLSVNMRNVQQSFIPTPMTAGVGDGDTRKSASTQTTGTRCYRPIEAFLVNVVNNALRGYLDRTGIMFFSAERFK